MGQSVEGKWHIGWYDTKTTGGRFQRLSSYYQSHIAMNPTAVVPLGPVQQL